MTTLAERFEAKYIPEPNSGCWLWVGARLTSGYGLVRFAKPRRMELAHRVSCNIYKNVIPDGMSVLHRCDNPPCVNPDHLFFGTQTDNHADMTRKGRNGAARGENGGNAKLTREQALDAKYSTDTTRECGKRLGVNHSCISAIRRGENWKHL